MRSSSYEVVFLKGLLPMRSSSYEVVFLWGHLYTRSSLYKVVFLGGHLPRRLSSYEVVFLWACLPMTSWFGLVWYGHGLVCKLTLNIQFRYFPGWGTPKIKTNSVQQSWSWVWACQNYHELPTLTISLTGNSKLSWAWLLNRTSP